MSSGKERDQKRRRSNNGGGRSLSLSSASGSGERKPSCFYKLILSPDVQSKKLRIPEVFTRAFSDELLGTAILAVPTGESWKVKVVKEDDYLWFLGGWQEFVEYFSISFAYFLLFKYEGNSKFEVGIFSPTACEISYPCNAHNKFLAGKHGSDDVGVVGSGASGASSDSDIEVITLDSEDEEPSLHGHEERISEDDDVVSDGFVGSLSVSDDDMKLDPDEGSMHSSNSGDANQGNPSVDHRWLKPEGLMEALASVGISMPENPFFVTLIKNYNVFKACYLRVPKDFAREYFMHWTEKHVKLEASNGKHWAVQCVRTSDSFNIGAGWIIFARENCLKAGDVCVFELADAEDRVLKVHVGIKSQLANQARWTKLLKHGSRNN